MEIIEKLIQEVDFESQQRRFAFVPTARLPYLTMALTWPRGLSINSGAQLVRLGFRSRQKGQSDVSSTRMFILTVLQGARWISSVGSYKYQSGSAYRDIDRWQV